MILPLRGHFVHEIPNQGRSAKDQTYDAAIEHQCFHAKGKEGRNIFKSRHARKIILLNRKSTGVYGGLGGWTEAPPIELRLTFEIPILPNRRQLVLDVYAQHDATNDQPNRTEIERDRLKGEWKQWRKLEQPRKIRHTRGNHSVKASGYTSNVRVGNQ